MLNSSSEEIQNSPHHQKSLTGVIRLLACFGGALNIKKVAAMAGVSVATISRVLNHPELVTPETRDRVLAVMQEQAYTPNWFAQGLNRGKTNTIALLVPSIEYGLYQKIITGIETIASSKRNVVLLCNTRNDPVVELDYLKTFVSRRVAGMVLVSSRLANKQAELLCQAHIPCVHVGKQRLPGCDTNCYIDFEDGAYRLTRHLSTLGHKKIGLILDRIQEGESTQMAKGYARAQQEAGQKEYLYYEENSVRGGHSVARRIMQAGELPEALVTASDEQAFGVMKAAQDQNLAIPEQLALASMTDSPLCSIVSPPLTCLDQPAQRLGMVAARMLFDSIENEDFEIGVPQEMILQSKLKIRKSCGNTKHIYELFD